MAGRGFRFATVDLILPETHQAHWARGLEDASLSDLQYLPVGRVPPSFAAVCPDLAAIIEDAQQACLPRHPSIDSVPFLNDLLF